MSNQFGYNKVEKVSKQHAVNLSGVQSPLWKRVRAGMESLYAVNES